MLSLMLPPRSPAPRAGPFDNVDDSRWFFTGRGAGVGTRAGVPVSEEVSLTLASWWCGCRVLAEPVGSLPCMVFERQDDDHRRTANDFSLFDILWRAPNPDMPSGPFREGRMLHQINYGNGFAEIQWDSPTPARRTRVEALWPIHASRVKPVRPSGQTAQDAEDYRAGYRYRVRNGDNTDTLLRADEMLHVPGIFPEDGIWAKSAVQYHRESIGFGLSLEQYGATFFGTGGQPRAVASGLGLRDPEARKQWRTEWKELHGSPNSAEIAVLPDGAKIDFLTAMTNENSQFLESRKFSVAQIARILRVPVYMLEETQGTASYASVEQRGIDFVVYSLLPWIRKWEEQCNLKLLLGPAEQQRYFIEFVLAGLLRGDFGSRMSGYVQALTNGIMTINEVRRLENLNGIGPAGDVNFVQMNMTTAQRMLEAPPEPPTRTRTTGAPPANGDGAQEADEFTRSMVRKLKAHGRKLQRLSAERKAALQLPPAPTPATPAAPRPDHLAVSRNAVRTLVADACCRALTKLCKALERESKQITSFEEWLTGFLGEHGPTLADALEPAAAVLGDAETTGAALWARLAQGARQTLGAAFETDTRQQLAERLAGYPRAAAEETAGELVGGAAAQGGQLMAQPSTPATGAPAGGGVAFNVNIPRDREATAIHEAAETQRQESVLTVMRQQMVAEREASDARTDRMLVALGDHFGRAMDAADDRMARAVAAVVEAIPEPAPPAPQAPTTVLNNITVVPSEVVVKENKVKVADQVVYRDEQGDMSRTVTTFDYVEDEQ